MDKKITELIQTDTLSPDSFFAIANKQEDRNYKINISDLIKHIQEFTKDDSVNLPSAFDAQVEDVTTVDKASASVDYKDGLFSFKFGLQKGPKGDKGETGEKGEPGIGKDGTSTRTVFAFRSATTKPEKPIGGFWNVETNTVSYPSGWSETDNLAHPVWMSNADFDEDGIIRDWSDPIQITGEDGVNGTDGVASEFVFKIFAKEQINLEPPYSNPKVDDYQTDGWIDHPTGVSKDMPYEYMCVRYKSIETGLWGKFSKPSLWSKYGVDGKDGDGIEYIYQITKSNQSPATPGKTPASTSPTTNYQEAEFIPASSGSEKPWTDNPTGVTASYAYEWVSTRKYKRNEQLWGDFSKPALWAKFGVDGQDGEDGTGVTILGSYDTYEQLEAAWKNGTLKGNNPPLVGDAYLVNGELWVFDGDDFYNCGQIQGPPGEKAYVHIKYADYLDRYGYGVFTDNEGETPGKYIGIRVDYVEMDSTTPSDYIWSQFTGNDGFGYEYIFQRSEEFVAPDVPVTITESNVAPAGWTDDPTGVDETYKYEWACYRKSDENGDWSEWKGKYGNTSKAWLFAMFAESVPGKTGSQGPVLFPMGYWEEGTYRQTWNDETNTPIATPYVLYKGDNKHYVLMVKETNEEPGNGTDWQLMENFSALYTDILLADRATVGNACFYGNYMFSQEGDGELSSFDITTNNPYKSNGFKPAWCVNLITGEMWSGTGKVYFGADGSGYIANNNISWGADGTLNFPALNATCWDSYVMEMNATGVSGYVYDLGSKWSSTNNDSFHEVVELMEDSRASLAQVLLQSVPGKTFYIKNSSGSSQTIAGTSVPDGAVAIAICFTSGIVCHVIQTEE